MSTDTFVKLINLTFAENSRVPSHAQGEILRYFNGRCRGGSFMNAVLSNDLMGAVSRADHINIEEFYHTVRWIDSNLPTICYGSPEKVEDWLKGRT